MHAATTYKNYFPLFTVKFLSLPLYQRILCSKEFNSENFIMKQQCNHSTVIRQFFKTLPFIFNKRSKSKIH